MAKTNGVANGTTNGHTIGTDGMNQSIVLRTLSISETLIRRLYYL